MVTIGIGTSVLTAESCVLAVESSLRTVESSGLSSGSPIRCSVRLHGIYIEGTIQWINTEFLVPSAVRRIRYAPSVQPLSLLPRSNLALPVFHMGLDFSMFCKVALGRECRWGIN